MNTLKLQENPKKLVKMGMLIAISIALVYLIHFPIFPAVPFMEYDPADIPILLGTFAFGTVGGLVLTIITSIIQGVTVSANSGVYGIIMHIIATGALTVVAGRIYETHKTKKRAIIGMICGGAGHGCSHGRCQFNYYAVIHGRAPCCCLAAHAFYHWV